MRNISNNAQITRLHRLTYDIIDQTVAPYFHENPKAKIRNMRALKKFQHEEEGTGDKIDFQKTASESLFRDENFF